MHWWEIATENPLVPPRQRAVAYYRHSAQDRQENSIPIQQDQVRQWARDNGVVSVKESPAAIAGPFPLPDEVARQYE
jgi:hypothetical protein